MRRYDTDFLQMLTHVSPLTKEAQKGLEQLTEWFSALEQRLNANSGVVNSPYDNKTWDKT
jgi:nitrate reductase assembly molybdenum cofactor insertion protein NarJ